MTVTGNPRAVEAKRWYQSKTVWFAVLTVGSTVLTGVAALLPTIEVVLPVAVYQITLFAVGMVNLILRALTTGPIDWGVKDDSLDTD